MTPVLLSPSWFLLLLHLLLSTSIHVPVWSFSPSDRQRLYRDADRACPLVYRSSIHTGSSARPQEEQVQDSTPSRTTRAAATATTTQEFSLSFPSYDELMLLRPGDYVASETVQVLVPDNDEDKDNKDKSSSSSSSNNKHMNTNRTHDFCVLLYPRGGGHSSNSVATNNKQLRLFGSNNNDAIDNVGFGMGHKMFPDKTEKLGLYLKYLPKNDNDSVDVTFSFLLKGKQVQGPKFDVDWSAGMRFVAPQASNLRDGLANDFGAHLMQTHLLSTFLGLNDDNDDDKTDTRLELKVSIATHPPANDETTHTLEAASSSSSSPSFPKGPGLLQTLRLPLVDIRQANTEREHNTELVRVGKIVVPVLSKLKQRRRMFEIGAYPGVEYRIMRILDPDGREIFGSVPGASYEVKPIYSLVDQLERQWPVQIHEGEIPKLLTSGMYNAISAIGSLLTAVFGLATAFVISQAISLFFIPSKSMDPTLQVKDVLVVEKVSPRVTAALRGGANNKKHVGDVVLFSPPDRLRQIVSSNGGRISDRDLFVKRIAAGPGDTVTVESNGAVKINGVAPTERRDLCEAEPLRLIERYIQPGTFSVGDNEVFVLGDCSDVSVDSRVWGALQSTDIVGKPLGRIWPLEHFGAIPALPTATEE